MKNRNKTAKGFTLIELLVVIAIIGILAALVLVALQSARDQARDAAIRGSIQQMRIVAEGHYAATDSYENVEGVQDYITLVNEIDNQGGAATTDTSDLAWCAFSTLNAGSTFCLDSAGGGGNQHTCSGVECVLQQ